MQDNELIKRIIQGDRRLFGDLAERYYDDVFRYCYYQTGNEQAAWDCTQETFYRLMRFLDNYTERGKFKAYLLRIALNACRDYFRRSSREELFYEEFSYEDFSEENVSSPGGRFSPRMLPRSSPESRAETSILIQGALNRLPQPQRETVVLYYYYGYKQREIARMTGAPLSTVKTRLRAATEKLQELFRQDGLL